MKWSKLYKRTTTTTMAAKKLTNDNESSSNEIFIRRSNIYYTLIITGTMAWHGHFFVNFSDIHTYDCEPCMCVQSDCKFHLIRYVFFLLFRSSYTLNDGEWGKWLKFAIQKSVFSPTFMFVVLLQHFFSCIFCSFDVFNPSSHDSHHGGVGWFMYLLVSFLVHNMTFT